ncbi:unnamed protein product [Arabidopsis halleri]
MSDRAQPSASEPVRNIVLVGPPGYGKSSTGNSLIGKEVFISETVECKTCKAKTLDGLIINVIDTPGLFDLSVSTDYMNKEISNCLTLTEGGLHAVVLVLSVGTDILKEEEAALNKLQLLFGSKIVDYLVVLFTGGDVLEKENKTLDDYLSSGCPEFLKTVLRLCGGRRVLFNNKTTDEVKKIEQVKQLLAHVEAIEKLNGGKALFIEENDLNVKRQGEMIMEQQKEVQSKKPEKTEVEEMKKQLEISYGQQMNMMAQMVEDTLKESSASHERMLLALKEKVERSYLENEDMHNETKRVCNIL